MSCYWHIHCDTCGEDHRFDNANHREALMLAIVGHATAIAALTPLFRDEAWEGDLHAGYSSLRIDIEWFARHHEHKLVPIDEYGRRSNQCRNGPRILCAAGYSHNCGLDADHEGPCQLTDRSHT